MSNKVLVIGLGKSGLAAYRLLLKKGFDVCITLNNTIDEQEAKLVSKAIVYDGHHPLELLDEDWKFIVKNPGIPYHIPFVKEALKRGFKIISEIELGWMFSENEILAITGTNGKTTTTTLTYDIVKEYYHNSYCGGNIGIPYSEIVLDYASNNYVVLELSSFQLMGTVTFKPYIATILNLAPDHLDYMGSVEAYYRSKMAIYANQDENDYFLFNEDDLLIKEYATNIKAQIITYSLTKASDIHIRDNCIYYYNQAIIRLDEIKVIGQHNLYNIMVAIGFSKLVNIPNNIIQKVIADFSGVEYRLELVDSCYSNIYYNDSKSTSADSTIIALDALKDKANLVLIVGGFDKGLDYTGLNDKINKMSNIDEVLVYGAIKEQFDGKLNKSLHKFDDLIAVDKHSREFKNKVILFSPATSSYDQYHNYEERGEHFNKLIRGE